MKFTMGGREFELAAEEVRRRMKHVEPEPFQKYIVEINNTVYPPKQVIDECVGFPRTSFTTMEAQRVLNRLGFVCREAGIGLDDRKAWIPVNGEGEGHVALHPNDIQVLKASMATIQMALAQLDERVTVLERQR